MLLSPVSSGRRLTASGMLCDPKLSTVDLTYNTGALKLYCTSYNIRYGQIKGLAYTKTKISMGLYLRQ